ncbi:hypothetical protein M885DRAFT_612161 [Pelagophyceae sp. CCMP2097]|nr:hypothetical protein M885DRAFT_612161 [Pelagophyceae sp. CCMP2097]
MLVVEPALRIDGPYSPSSATASTPLAVAVSYDFAARSPPGDIALLATSARRAIEAAADAPSECHILVPGRSYEAIPSAPCACCAPCDAAICLCGAHRPARPPADRAAGLPACPACQCDAKDPRCCTLMIHDTCRRGGGSRGSDAAGLYVGYGCNFGCLCGRRTANRIPMAAVPPPPAVVSAARRCLVLRSSSVAQAARQQAVAATTAMHR